VSETTLERPIEASGTFAVGPKTVYRWVTGLQLTAGIWGEPKDRATCIAVLRRAVELGVTSSTRRLLRARGERAAHRRCPPPLRRRPADRTKAGLTARALRNGTRRGDPSTCASNSR